MSRPAVDAPPPAGPGRAPTARKFVGETKWATLGYAASQFSWYAAVVVLARLIPPDAFGAVALGLALVGVASLIAYAGTGGSVIAAPTLRRDEVRKTVVLNLVLGAVLAVAIAASAPFLVDWLGEGAHAGAIQVLSVSLLLAGLAVVPVALLKKALRFKVNAAINSGASVATAIAAIAAAFAGAGVWALVLRQVLLNAMVAGIAWFKARDLVSHFSAPPDAPPVERPRDRHLFLIVAASTFLARGVDKLVVGEATDAVQLGFYALAFTMGYAPMTQLGWQIGDVLFPATAATADRRVVGIRTVRVTRFTGLLLLPLVPVAFVLAPTLIPALLGDRWEPTVAPFQVLFAASAVYSITNVVGDTLSGTQNIRFRARFDPAWAVGTLALMIVLVRVDGIRGAAVAQLLMVVPMAAAYWVWGARLVGTDLWEIARALRALVVAVAAQSVATYAALLLLAEAGVDGLLGAAGAAAIGAIVAVALLWIAPSKPLADMVLVLRMLLGRDRGGTTETG